MNYDNETVRCNVAENPNTPTDILIKIASDEYWFVRKQVARNTSTPIEVLVELAGDGYSDVRYTVSQTHKSRTDIRLIFALYASSTIDEKELESRVNAL